MKVDFLAKKIGCQKYGSKIWSRIMSAVLCAAIVSTCMGSVLTAFAATRNQRGIFQGNLSDYEFVPANVVTFTINYQYSKTGGLFGVSPNAPEMIQAPAAKDGENYVFEIPIKSKSGFRIVLDSTPLDAYLHKQPPKNATPEELQQMLDNGDFNGDITAHEVYAYQEKAHDLAAAPDYTIINKAYSNIYSTQYNQDWNKARIFKAEGADGYAAMAVCGDQASEHPDQADENHGANELKNPKLKVTLTKEQLENALKNGLTITVNYRRTTTWYAVKHWVPVGLSGLSQAEIDSKEKTAIDGVDYVLLDSENLQGRVGALTKAVARTDGNVFEKLTSIPFAQELIKGIVSISDLNQNDADEKSKPTVINIYYKAAEAYRVIFDTDYAYIRRQQVVFGNSVDFNAVTAVPARKGYTFDGWQYLKKGSTPDENGKYEDDRYIEVPKNGNDYTLKIDAALLNNAQFKTTDGVSSLHLYPRWKAAKTNITVVLWTEDLDGLTDVQAFAEGGNVKKDGSDYYSQKYKDYKEEVTSNKPILNDSTKTNANYSNVGSFTMQVGTGSSLVDGGNALVPDIFNLVEKEFNKSARDGESGVAPINFYDYCGFEVMHENNGEMEYLTTANADGKTIVYVYFTRKIYTLKFHYYGKRNNQNFAVATGTCGYSYAGQDCYDKDGNLIFDYREERDIGTGKKGNLWYTVPNAETINTPHTITIKAKYGADLRAVWPVALPGENIKREGQKNVELISWTATRGKYRDDSIKSSSSHYDEATIMGLFASLNEEIIAAPANTEIVHHMVAYWENQYDISYYRYTHCYEVPGLDIDSEGIKVVSLYGESGELKNTLYLVPKDNEVFAKYGFTDLITVKYDAAAKTVEYSEYGQDNGGSYYAVRGYVTTGSNGEPVTKYYAVSRRVDTVSTNAIEKQNPSARAHMTKVNDVADHTTERKDKDGRTWANPPSIVGSEEDPYDLYFYYDRDRYTITYKVSVNKSDTEVTERDLGYIELPYGAHVTKDDYAFKLNYMDTNQEKADDKAKYLWSYPDGDPVPVCPDRNKEGTKVWNFKGWGLGPAGVNMLWQFDTETSEHAVPQAQATDDFYIGSDLLFYAIWENPICNVTFHLNGGTAATFAADPDRAITVRVPANTKITETDAKIPRPFYSGHTMEGWYKADAKGNLQEPETQFDFNDFITDDIHIAAKWTVETVKSYRYKVYFVTDNPTDADTAREKIYIKDDGQIAQEDTTGAKAYYILGIEERGKMYAPGTTINLTAQELAGYIPTETNKLLTLNEEGNEYYVIFYYDSYVNGSYIVRFVEAGTEQGADPAVIQQNVISEESVKAEKAILTPSINAVETLRNKGYMLVNRSGGNTYSQVEKYEELKWLDSKGDFHPLSVDLTDLLKEDAERTITYLVEPIVYTIAYQNADNSPAAADNALSAVTAENTPVGNAGEKNPTLYTAKDHFTLKNPSRVYENGKWYQFSHWSLGNGTTEAGEDGRTYATLIVNQKTVGNLTFVANWAELTDIGDLMVAKTVSGDRGDTNQAFTFTVTLSDTSINGTHGGMTFTDGVATFQLKHGESVTGQGIPAGTGYTVEESDNAGYTVTSSGAAGTIENGVTAVAEFNNHKSGNPPDGPTEPTTPNTRDEANLTLWLALTIVSGIGIILILATSQLRQKGKGAKVK